MLLNRRLVARLLSCAEEILNLHQASCIKYSSFALKCLRKHTPNGRRDGETQSILASRTKEPAMRCKRKIKSHSFTVTNSSASPRHCVSCEKFVGEADKKYLTILPWVKCEAFFNEKLMITALMLPAFSPHKHSHLTLEHIQHTTYFGKPSFISVFLSFPQSFTSIFHQSLAPLCNNSWLIQPSRNKPALSPANPRTNCPHSKFIPPHP